MSSEKLRYFIRNDWAVNKQQDVQQEEAIVQIENSITGGVTATLVSGHFNTASAPNSFVIGGSFNNTEAPNSVIVGGSGNTIYATGADSIALGGMNISATAANTVYMNKAELTENGSGIIMHSQNGSRYNIFVNDDGSLSAVTV